MLYSSIDNEIIVSLVDLNIYIHTRAGVPHKSEVAQANSVK